jgi:catechol 2,3-dioxygenase-like lactoylglutathione lyase family enzyme
MKADTHPFVRQIDHIGIYAEDPQPVFTFFSEVLGLPVAFPYTEYAHYTSGSVALGNCFLEIMRFGQPLQEAVPQNRASYFILGFLTGEGGLAAAQQELSLRNVSYSDIVPFFDPAATDDNPIQIWANLYLGRLLGENLWMRLFFALTRQAEPTPSAMQSPLLNRLSLSLMRRAFAQGMPVVTEYYRQREAHQQAISREPLLEAGGGLLGVERVGEVVIGVHAWAPWTHFLAPLAVDDDGVVRLGPGPSLRLVSARSPAIKRISLQVKSLERAQAALAESGAGHSVAGDRLAFTVPDSGGLSLELASSSSS